MSRCWKLHPADRFNPRPALAGRASQMFGIPDRGKVVSILARPSRAGRRRRMAVASVAWLFQSSPGHRGPGVCKTCHDGRKAREVSILARPSRAGRLDGAMGVRACSEFQSSPGPRGPGVCGVFRPRSAGAGFNPRPALAGRASSSQLMSHSRIMTFQSSPGPRGPGVLKWAKFNGKEYLVSILARPSRAGRRLRPPTWG